MGDSSWVAHEVLERLRRIERLLLHLNYRQELTVTALSDLQAAVAAEDTAIGAVVAYLQGLPALIAAAVAAAEAGDSATVTSITADVTAQTAALTAALAAAQGPTGASGATGP
jgi:hypothetical protein